MRKKKKTKEKYGDTCFVKCLIQPGLFRGEWLAYLDALNPQPGESNIKVQMFVDERDVKGFSETPARGHPVPALVRVSFIRRIGSVVQVVLPQPSVPIGENVFFNKDQVVEIGGCWR